MYIPPLSERVGYSPYLTSPLAEVKKHPIGVCDSQRVINSEEKVILKDAKRILD